MIADALDLRHRLPSIWAAAQAGQVPAYQARRIAHATRHLTAVHAATVDQRVAPSLGAVSWGRLERLLEAAIIAADPDAAERAAAAAAQERFVRLGYSSEHGLKLIIARATAGDAIWFKATIDRIADILGRDGDSDRYRRASLQSHRHPRPTRPSPPTALPTPARQRGWTTRTRRSRNRTRRASTSPSMNPAIRKIWGAAGSRPAGRRATFNAHADREPATPISHALRVTPPPFDPVRARSRVIIYVHVAAEALAAGTGITRVENVGPVMLGQLSTVLGENCSIGLKPVIDLPLDTSPSTATKSRPSCAHNSYSATPLMCFHTPPQ